MKNFLAVLTALTLLTIGFHYFLSKEQTDLLLHASFAVHAISLLLALPVYLISGVELYIIYERYSKLRIKTYDVITLPLVMNLWGYLFPIQGSFLYTLAYFKLKYKASLISSFNIYVFIFSITMVFSGLLGVVYSLIIKGNTSIYFILLSVVLFINPVFFLLAKKTLGVTRLDKFNMLQKRVDEIFDGISKLFAQKSTVLLLISTNILAVVLNTVWTYWITYSLGLHISISVLLLLSGLMKLTLIVKIAPGNLGVTQLFASGMVGLIGGNAAEGFLLSAFQYITVIILAFTLGTVFTIVNMKYFSWQSIKSVMLQKETTGQE